MSKTISPSFDKESEKKLIVNFNLPDHIENKEGRNNLPEVCASGSRISPSLIICENQEDVLLNQ